MDMRITKIIRHDKGQIEIHHTQEAQMGGVETAAVKSPDAARPEFYNALQGMARHVCHVLDLPEEYARGMAIRGVDIAWEGEKMGITFKVEKTIYGLDPWKSSTPRIDYIQEEGVRNVVVEDLIVLFEEAIRYVSGDRAQVGMDFDRKAA